VRCNGDVQEGRKHTGGLAAECRGARPNECCRQSSARRRREKRRSLPRRRRSGWVTSAGLICEPRMAQKRGGETVGRWRYRCGTPEQWGSKDNVPTDSRAGRLSSEACGECKQEEEDDEHDEQEPVAARGVHVQFTLRLRLRAGRRGVLKPYLRYRRPRAIDKRKVQRAPRAPS
jgi:hypothetical protein